MSGQDYGYNQDSYNPYYDDSYAYPNQDDQNIYYDYGQENDYGYENYNGKNQDNNFGD